MRRTINLELSSEQFQQLEKSLLYMHSLREVIKLPGGDLRDLRTLVLEAWFKGKDTERS